MKLFTKEIDKKLAAQYHLGADLNAQVVVAKIFNPYGNGRWYLINSDPSDPDYLWAIVQIGDIVEVGSVSRKELENLRVGRLRFPLERDLGFSQRNAQEVYNGVISGKTYAKGGMADVTPTYAAGGINEEELTKFAEALQSAESEVWDNLDIRSGGQLYRTASLQKQYATQMAQAFKDVAKKFAHLKDMNLEDAQMVHDILEDQNYHSLNNYLAIKGVYGPNMKKLYVGQHAQSPDNYLDPANMGGAQSYAVGGLTPGRWYKDNQGVEYKFIGKIDNGPNKDQLLFTDGTEKMYKPLDDFGAKPKENKLFGWFEDGGEIDLFEHYEDIPPHVKKVLDKYNEGLEEGDYEALEKAKNELETIGYTFDYDLGGGAYNLHKMEEGDSMSGYMADGGELAKQKAESERSILRSIGQDYIKRLTAYRNLFVVNSETYKLINDRIYDLNSIEIDFLTHSDKDLRTDLANIGMLADGGEIYTKPLNRATNLKVRDYLEKEGLSKQDTGGDYEKFLGQALVTSLRDSNFSKEANEIIYILDKSVKGDEVYDTKYYNPIPSIVRIGEKVAKICKYDAVEITDAYFFVSKMYGNGSVANAIGKVFGRYELSGKFKFEKGGYMAMGGKTKFAVKVKSIQASLLKRKKVAPSVQKDYGKTYNKAEAKESATRIVGALTAKERLMAKKKK
jgi:hypothetical protein